METTPTSGRDNAECGWVGGSTVWLIRQSYIKLKDPGVNAYFDLMANLPNSRFAIDSRTRKRHYL